MWEVVVRFSPVLGNAESREPEIAGPEPKTRSPEGLGRCPELRV